MNWLKNFLRRLLYEADVAYEAEANDERFASMRKPKPEPAGEWRTTTTHTIKTMRSSDGGRSGSVETRPMTDKEIKAFNDGFSEIDKAWTHFDKAFDHFDKL